MNTHMSLEARIQVLEDIESIKKLKYSYAYRMDERDWDGVIDLFAIKGQADWGVYGFCATRKDLESYFRETQPKFFSFHIHMLHNPIINIQGNGATGLMVPDRTRDI